MTNNVVTLTWDSDFFSKKIATVVNIDNVTAADLASFDLITNKVASNNYSDLTQFNQLGFSLAEGELFFSKALIQMPTNNTLISLAKEEDISELVSLAKISYVSTRFRQPWFTDEQSNNFYGTWIKKAVLGECGDVCLVIKTGGSIEGCIS